MDLTNRVWTVPASRMTAEREHRGRSVGGRWTRSARRSANARMDIDRWSLRPHRHQPRSHQLATPPAVL